MLLGVFAFNTTPRIFIHQFFRHHDTEDAPQTSSKEGVSFSAKHVHCGFLKIEPEPYEHTTVFYSMLVKSVIWRFATPAIPGISHILYRMLPSRAPPVALTV
jgi:hypothetical protein